MRRVGGQLPQKNDGKVADGGADSIIWVPKKLPDGKNGRPQSLVSKGISKVSKKIEKIGKNRLTYPAGRI